MQDRERSSKCKAPTTESSLLQAKKWNRIVSAFFLLFFLFIHHISFQLCPKIYIHIYFPPQKTLIYLFFLFFFCCQISFFLIPYLFLDWKKVEMAEWEWTKKFIIVNEDSTYQVFYFFFRDVLSFFNRVVIGKFFFLHCFFIHCKKKRRKKK